LSPHERLVRGNVCGAFAVSVEGDWEGLPRRPELATMFSADNVGR
jgi:2-dehydro-3-deoxygluconokinase